MPRNPRESFGGGDYEGSHLAAFETVQLTAHLIFPEARGPWVQRHCDVLHRLTDGHQVLCNGVGGRRQGAGEGNVQRLASSGRQCRNK